MKSFRTERPFIQPSPATSFEAKPDRRAEVYIERAQAAVAENDAHIESILALLESAEGNRTASVLGFVELQQRQREIQAFCARARLPAERVKRLLAHLATTNTFESGSGLF